MQGSGAACSEAEMRRSKTRSDLFGYGIWKIHVNFSSVDFFFFFFAFSAVTQTLRFLLCVELEIISKEIWVFLLVTKRTSYALSENCVLLYQLLTMLRVSRYSFDCSTIAQLFWWVCFIQSHTNMHDFSWCSITNSYFCLIPGTEAWPPGVCLKYVGGDQFGHVNMVMVRSLEPQEIADVSVQMCSPSTAGMYQGQWRMCTATGLYYGGERSLFWHFKLFFMVFPL